MSNYLNLVSKFFGVRPKNAPAATLAQAPPVKKVGQDYVTDLDNILKNAQLKFTNLLQSPDLKPLRRYIGDVDFIQQSEKLKRLRPTPMVSGPANPDLDFSKNPPVSNSKKGLPINSIMEGAHLDWKKRANRLRDLINETAREIQEYLIDMAQSVNYNPPKKDIRSLTTDLGKNRFTGIDRKTVLEVIKRIKIFRSAYDHIVTWINFFERIDKNQSKAARKKI